VLAKSENSKSTPPQNAYQTALSSSSLCWIATPIPNIAAAASVASSFQSHASQEGTSQGFVDEPSNGKFFI